jgi:hypothetical protein
MISLRPEDLFEICSELVNISVNRGKIYICARVTPRNRILVQKSTVTQLDENFPPSMKPKVSLPCLQEPFDGPNSEPAKSSQHSH